MKTTHDAFANLAAGTPYWFTLAVRCLPIGVLAQFLTAGTALFRDSGWWGLHAMTGGALGVAVLAILCSALAIRHLQGFRWWAGLSFALYAAQVALAASNSSLSLSLHPLNGALLLTASLVLLAKVERSRRQGITDIASSSCR